MKKLIIETVIIIILMIFLGGVASPNGGWKDRKVTTAHGSTGSIEIQTIKILYFSPNIQPGEQLWVSWWVKNVGLSAVKIKVSLRGVPGYLQVRFLPGLNFRLLPRVKKNVALSIRMPYGTLQTNPIKNSLSRLFLKLPKISNVSRRQLGRTVINI